MKQFKKLKKVWALMLALVMMLSVVPAETAWAADKYEVKRACAKEGVTFVNENGVHLEVVVCKNGKDISAKVRKQVKWKSSDASIVAVESWGADAEVRGKKKGTATITATYKGKSCSFKVIVKGATLTVGGTGKSKGYVPAGQTLQMRARGAGWGNSEKTGTIHYSSSNSAVAKVVSDKYGDKVIKGLKEGTATITAKSKLGTLKCTVTVLPRMKLQIKKFEAIYKDKSYEDLIGYSCEVVNKGEKPITFFESGGYSESERCKIKGGSVTIKPGESKKVTALYEEEQYVTPRSAYYSVKYAGHKFVTYVSNESKGIYPLAMGSVSETYDAMHEVWDDGGAG